MRSVLMIAAGAALWILLTRRLHKQRAWLAYYITGAFGFTILTLFVAQLFGLDARLEGFEAHHVAAVGWLFGLRLRVMGPSGLAIPAPYGWSIFDIGIECSALLETAVFVGLIAFYPAYNRARKASSIISGSIATYGINLIRILVIVGLVAAFGESWTFVAHAVIGRLVFFVMTVGVYWFLLTRPTIRVVAESLPPEDRSG